MSDTSEQLFECRLIHVDICIEMSDLSLPIVGYVVDVPGEEAEFSDRAATPACL